MVYAEPEASLRECMDRLPRRAIATDKDVAKLITDAFQVGDDCRSKLQATWDSIDNTRERVRLFNQSQEKIGDK